ncbi:hypothetical protein MCOR27_005517 [Pyricularia oryzae]|uniref:Uncharacterized protein n=2 Tax=Pyricularia TaxID=48558 RepID=A0ABQ8NH21_PYRGI|nr:uncharacterized protein MGG_04525 [Pyricularia oryzae 70-15]KAH9437822.1 hypothetical protein MCOR02_001467 [Pyricularia oryzae]KAI6296971.1 hypothetical protein MCOR33_006595 [Pyricularia grisea]EHA53769.1 hypothetical protein MGG_04525 [Pyricularia oryzae 70-15]KAI6278076.1 hypothetical protein MCOR26_004795 [Pyricularia oryzae]KAI6278629.1 hypothetical protein MCOR27_005517 [Pyricularia oryzae]
MLAASINWLQIAKIVVPLVLIVQLLIFLTSNGDTSKLEGFTRPFKGEKLAFISDFLSHEEYGGAFDGQPIADMCAGRSWNPDRIVQCDAVPEGVGTVRNGHLQCIRFAIEIGAGGLILPEIVRRSEHNIAEAIPNAKGPLRGVGLDYFFDSNHLTSTLTKFCPQMRLYPSINGLHNVPSLLTGVKVKLDQLQPPRINISSTVVENLDRFWEQVRTLISKEDDGKRKPLKIQLAWSPFWYSVDHDSPEFVKSFGQLLRTRHDVRQSAGSVLYSLKTRFNLDLDPRKPPKGQTGEEVARKVAEGRSFLGVRIRTDADAKSMKWPSYDTQATYFERLVGQNQIPVTYMAQGAAKADVRNFKANSAGFNGVVVCKEDLLTGPELETLQSLSWDQQALVDYEVMLSAGIIAGIAHSSFLWNLAIRRRVDFWGPKNQGQSKNGLVLPDGTITYQDPYSIIFGPGEGETSAVLSESMRLAIWP